MRKKILTPEIIALVSAEVKMMLHASRDCYRNQGKDTSRMRFDCRDGYYGEAFGVMRGLQVLGYGKLGAVNTPQEVTNLRWWFGELEREVLEEENYKGSGECDYCLERYGKDDANRTRARDLV